MENVKIVSLRPHYHETFDFLFRFENALRIFVYSVLKEAHLSEWKMQSFPSGKETSGPNSSQSISSIAKKRRSESSTFGYHGVPILSPMLFLTSGELLELIETHWEHFRENFEASKNVVSMKLAEVIAVRNSLAHFRQVTQTDRTRAVLLARDVSYGIFRHLGQLLGDQAYKRIPSNDRAEWYQAFRSAFDAYRSKGLGMWALRNERFAKIVLLVRLPLVSTGEEDYPVDSIGNLMSDRILELFSGLAGIHFLSERIAFIDESRVDDLNDPPTITYGFGTRLLKMLEFTMSEKAMPRWSSEFISHFCMFLDALKRDIELVGSDPLAEGDLIRVEHVVGGFPGNVYDQSSHEDHEERHGQLSKQFSRPATNYNYPEYIGRNDGRFRVGSSIESFDAFPWFHGTT